MALFVSEAQFHFDGHAYWEIQHEQRYPKQEWSKAFYDNPTLLALGSPCHYGLQQLSWYIRYDAASHGVDRQSLPLPRLVAARSGGGDTERRPRLNKPKTSRILLAHPLMPFTNMTTGKQTPRNFTSPYFS